MLLTDRLRRGVRTSGLGIPALRFKRQIQDEELPQQQRIPPPPVDVAAPDPRVARRKQPGRWDAFSDEARWGKQTDEARWGGQMKDEAREINEAMDTRMRLADPTISSGEHQRLLGIDPDRPGSLAHRNYPEVFGLRNYYG